jgi:hypothetical protein
MFRCFHSFLVQSEEFTLQLLWLGKKFNRDRYGVNNQGGEVSCMSFSRGTARVFPTPQICAFLIFFILPNLRDF